MIKIGIYRHHKGNHYQVLHTATHSETGEQLVVYQALYGDYGIWVRPVAMFCEAVIIDGKNVLRFELIKELS